MNNEVNAQEVESEFSTMCAWINKVTHKLLLPIVVAGSFECVFNLIYRLHLEKSFDTALTVSILLKLKQSSDRILILKKNRFNLPDDDFGDDSDDDFTYSERKKSSVCSTNRNDLFDFREVTPGIYLLIHN